jgi:hypothetical protein
MGDLLLIGILPSAVDNAVINRSVQFPFISGLIIDALRSAMIDANADAPSYDRMRLISKYQIVVINTIK